LLSCSGSASGRDLDDFVALEHAEAPKRGGKVLFAFDERQ